MCSSDLLTQLYRAAWKPGVKPFAAEGEAAGKQWLETKGKANIDRLNKVLADTATPWTDKVSHE